MDLPESALRDFERLRETLRRRGAKIDTDLREIVDDDQIRRLRSAYQDGDAEKAEQLLYNLIRMRLKLKTLDAKRHLKTVQQKVSRHQEALSALDQRNDSASDIDYVVGQNIQVLRRLFDLSKTALAEKTGVITRQTLLKIEKGKGLRLNVIEAIARALNVPSEALLLAPDKLGVLCELTRPTDPMQALLCEIFDDPNEAALYAHQIDDGKRLGREALLIVGDVLEITDDRYGNPSARAGAALGWLWGLPSGRMETVDNVVTRNLVAAVVGGWWVHSLRHSTQLS
ncbi:helix-turn-helix transcriptional regulator [Salinibacter sp.]|uniref:helix-turn-helix transcriptional regulator n=1 Tax=Salinibacter sp. TaxID=2065818 RepID=UPI0021E88812|nr:helix-turn-helix transcriptional regulator [Salinibacter sp.]